MSDDGRPSIVDVSRGWGAPSPIARDETERATATRGTAAHCRDGDDERDVRGVDGARGGVGHCGAHERRGVELEQVSCARKIRATGGTEEPVVADLGEAPREHVFEKARDERVHRERQPSGLVRARVGVAEGDAPVREGFEPVIGEGDVIDVAREIARREGCSTESNGADCRAPRFCQRVR